MTNTDNRRERFARSAPDSSALPAEEQVRKSAHAGVEFREGPCGRRAGLIRGPDVWEVVAAALDVQASHPQLATSSIIASVADLTSVPTSAVRTAMDYYQVFRSEIDAEIASNAAAEEEIRQ